MLHASAVQSSSAQAGNDMDEDEEFEVERILAERTGADGKVRYLVSWVGYQDYEASWEGKEQFSDVATITEWERQRDNGDTLDEIELADLLNKMHEHLCNEEAKQQVKKAASMPARPDDEGPQQPSKKRQKTAQHFDGSIPLLKNRAASPVNSKAPTGSTLASNSRPLPHLNTLSTRRLSHGTKFRNLQHVGRARKKAAQEPPVNPDDPNLKTVAFGTAAAPASPSEDDSLFFPDPSANRDVEERDQRTPATTKREPPPSPVQGRVIPVMTKKLLTRPKVSSQNTSDTATIVPIQNVGTIVGTAPTADITVSMKTVHNAPSPPSNTAFTTALNGRSWSKNELLAHVTIGQHAIGDVKIVDLDFYCRGQLFALKKQLESHEIRLEFEQEKVLPSSAILEMSKSWYGHADACSHVKPFEDTAQACHEFSAYLQQHDLTAVWGHPATDVVLLLFAPQSAFWRSQEPFRRQQVHPDLIVSSRRRHNAQGIAPIPKPSTICRFWAAGKHCKFGDACNFSHPAKDSLDKLNGSSRTLSPPLETSAKGNTDGLSKGPASSSTARPLPLRRMSEVSKRPTQSTLQPNTDFKAKAVVKAQEGRRKSFPELMSDIVMKDAPFQPETLESPQEMHVTTLDWTFDTDYRSLVKNIKNQNIASSSTPYILIALPEQFDVQSQALKSWAERHTGQRSIFVLGKSASQEWEEFLRFSRPSDPSILFFHESYPIYTQLQDFSKLLHRDEVACHAVSWNTDLGAKKSSYQLTPLFPRGNLIHITEDALISKPVQASYVVSWFASNLRSKKMSGKLMLRPNVQEFLEKYALVCLTDGKKQEANDTLDLLKRVTELSLAVDVTIPGAAAKFGASLGGADLIAQSGFVPFPYIPGYDHSATASVNEKAVMERDQFLLDYFTIFSVAESSRYRKLLVLHDGKASQTPTSQHIAFRSVASFVAEVDGRKSKGSDGRQ